MPQIFGVRFREIGQITYLIYSGKEKIKTGDIIIAKTRRGLENGKVLVKVSKENFVDAAKPTEKIIRVATKEDLKSIEDKCNEEKEAGNVCKSKIEEHKLKMKLIDVECIFDRSKIIFYFIVPRFTAILYIILTMRMKTATMTTMRVRNMVMSIIMKRGR